MRGVRPRRIVRGGGGARGGRRSLPEALTVCSKLALTKGSEFAGLVAFLPLLKLSTDRCEEGLEMGVKILRSDLQIPVQEEQKLFLHQVDLCKREAKALISSHRRIPSPVLVLGGRIVQVLGRQDERGQKDPVNSAPHTLGDWW